MSDRHKNIILWNIQFEIIHSLTLNEASTKVQSKPKSYVHWNPMELKNEAPRGSLIANSQNVPVLSLLRNVLTYERYRLMLLEATK